MPSERPMANTENRGVFTIISSILYSISISVGMSSEKKTCDGDAISSLTSPIVLFTVTPNVLGRQVAGSASIASALSKSYSARNFSISDAITVLPVPPLPATAMIFALSLFILHNVYCFFGNGFFKKNINRLNLKKMNRYKTSNEKWFKLAFMSQLQGQ
jgi:hypothetical protein